MKFGAPAQNFKQLDWSFSNVQTGANTNETVLKAYTIPASFLNANGKRLHFAFWGLFGANANNKTLRVRLGPVTLTGTAIFTSGPIAYNGLTWRIEGHLFRRVTDGQSPIIVLQCSGAVVAQISDVEITAAGNDDDTAMLLECTGQNGTASAGDIGCDGHFVEYIAAP